MGSADHWQGRVTFEDRYVRFDGGTGDNRPHSHVAIQVVIGADCRVELANGRQFVGPGIVVRPHVPHRLLPLAQGRVYLVEPTSDIGAALLASLPDEPVQLVDDIQRRLDRLLDARLAEPIDPRLQAAINLLSGPAALQNDLAGIARKVGLSPERLRAIAARQLGMTLAGWRRWAAVRRACEAMIDGATPAEAALLGGFSDQAHFTRTTRSMLGITPAALAQVVA